MRSHLRNAAYLQLAVLTMISMAWPQDIGSSSITGHVTLDQQISSLTVRLYSPKTSNSSQYESGSQQAESASRHVRAAFISGDGRFAFSGLKPGSYLLEIYSGQQLLYQKVVSTRESQPLEIALNVTGPPILFDKGGWRPADMTADMTSGVFVLDTAGGVSRLSTDAQGSHIDRVFQLPGSYQGYSIAADEQHVYVAAKSKLGCTVFRYSLADKKTTERLVAVNNACFGIASDGNAVYLTFPQANEIRYLPSWRSSDSHSWALNDVQDIGPIVFDKIGQRLIVADHSGKAYAVSIPDGKQQLIGMNLGWVNSISASREHILIASGTKVLSLARSNNQGENPPPSLQSLTGGHIVGVAVDANDRAWFADYDKELVKGPLPLN